MGISWKRLCIFGIIPLVIGCRRLPSMEQINSTVEQLGIAPSLRGEGPDLIRVAVIIGKTSEHSVTRAASVSVDDILTLATLGRERFLEIRVMPLCNANRASLRVRFDAPPEAPKASENALLRQAEESQLAQAQATYDQAMVAHAAGFDRAFGELKGGLEDALSPKDCTDSLVEKGLVAMDTIAGEEIADGIRAHTYLIFVSDGIDAYTGVQCDSREFAALEQSDVFVVSGDTDLKLLECFGPKRFEAFDAVRDYLLDSLQGSENQVETSSHREE